MRSFPVLYLIVFLLFFILVVYGSLKNIQKITANKFKRKISIGFLLLHVLMLLVFIYLYIYPNQPREATNYTVYIIYNFILFALLVFNFPNAFSYFLYVIFARKRPPVIPYAGFIIAIAIVVSMVFGVLFGSRQTKTVYHELSFNNLPARFDGYKLFVFTDSHLGGILFGKSLLKKADKIVEQTNPDLILFIGDLVNNFAYETLGYEALFQEITKNAASYSILGNHDYGDYSDWECMEKKQANFDAILEA
ncbi:MAG: metallophosphoesterase, partial [Bacteroidota bacterium]